MPFADTTHLKVPDGSPTKSFVLSDILPTGWQAAGNATSSPAIRGDMGLRSGRPDGDPQRLAARRRTGGGHRSPGRPAVDGGRAGAITINFETESVIGRLNDLTDGQGPQKCIEAVGTESHVSLAQPDTLYDRAKQMMLMENDRPHALREMIYACRPGGTISIVGVYTGLVDRYVGHP